MPAPLPLRLRQQVVHAYTTGLVKTYAEAAEMFGLGPATVSRLLRLQRETGDVVPRPNPGGRRRAVDDDWLRAHALACPDALLRERVDDWLEHSGKRVHLSTMSDAMKRLGWTHKKRRRRLAKGQDQASSHDSMIS